MQLRRLMIGLSDTDTDQALLEYAAMVVRLCEPSDVCFVHVLPTQTDSPPMGAPHASESASTRLERLIATAFPGGRFATHLQVLSGPRLDQLLACAADQRVDLIIVGHRLSRSGRRSLARRLAMKAPCSVWMAPEGSLAAVRSIIVPVDFSEHAADALREGSRLAQIAGASCTALHVGLPDTSLLHESLRAGDRDRIHAALNNLATSVGARGSVTQLIEYGPDAARMILEVAGQRGADLIVMGTRGRSASAAILLGSVTEQVMMESHFPVLTVTRPGARLGVLQALLGADSWQSRQQ